MDIESLSIEELAELISPSSAAYKELQRRNVLRTKNVVGELGEYYVIDYFNNTSSLPNLSLAPPGVQNIDALSRNGEIYSIKTISSINGTTGSFCNPESIENNERKFHYLIIAILDQKFSLQMMLQLTWDEFFKYNKFNKRMNNYNISVTKTLISNVEVIFDSEM